MAAEQKQKDHAFSISVLEATLSKSYSSILKKVIEMAKDAHDGDLRKNTDEPYILHVLRVGVTLYKLDASEYVIAGGILHGVLEHTKWTKDDLAGRLNKIFAPLAVQMIIGYVAAVIEYFEGKNFEEKISWEKRKKIFLKRQAITSDDALLIIFADKLDILASLVADYQKRGEDIWQTLSTQHSSSRRERYEHYAGLYQLFRARFASKDKIWPFFDEYEKYLKILFSEVVGTVEK